MRAALYYVLLFCRVAFIIIGQLYSCIAHSYLIQIVSVASWIEHTPPKVALQRSPWKNLRRELSPITTGADKKI